MILLLNLVNSMYLIYYSMTFEQKNININNIKVIKIDKCFILDKKRK